MNCIVSGASSGIGRDIVQYLLNREHNVLALARRGVLLGQIPMKKGLATLAVDLSEEESREKLKPILEDWEKVDLIINNAGQLINKSFIETQADEFKQQYTANVITAVNLIQAADPYLKEGSHIVNISSMGGFQGSSKYPGLSAYSSAKGALSILSECLAEEYKERGISVNALALGAVQTEMLEKAFPGYQAPLSSEQMAKYIADFAITSASFISGKVLPVSLANP